MREAPNFALQYRLKAADGANARTLDYFCLHYYPETVARWRPLVAWLLAIPYVFVASILVYVAAIVAFIGVFVILFTRELPEGMFKLILIPARWQLRGHVYSLWMATVYPPFDWDESATRPAP